MDEYKRSPLHYVCIDNQPDKILEIANDLIKSGYDVNAKDVSKWTPLHFAAQQNCSEIVELLIANGADIEAQEINGNTPLWVAAMNSTQGTQAVKSLVHAGADPGAKNIHGISPKDIESGLFSN